MLLGKIYQNREIYRLVQIYPEISFDVTFDLMDGCEKIKYPGGLKLGNKGKKGEIPKVVYDGSKITPFEKFGL
jgi:hypothetical protein